MKNCLKIFMVLLAYIFAYNVADAQSINTMKTTGGVGISLGSLIAVLLSWERNKSILWAIIHCFCSWFYVVYYLITR